MSKQASFSLVAAFSNSPFGGNPAAVIFLDPKNTPEDTLAGIARNVNQPMTAFISPSQLSPENDTIAVYDIRYFAANGVEVSLCGHATLAAAKVLFSQTGMASISVLQFHTHMEGVVAAKRIEDGRVEIEFPTGTTTELSDQEKSRITPLINKAFGWEVVINYLGASGPPYEHGEMITRWIYPVAEFIITALLIELEEKENLAECKVDAEAFVSQMSVIQRQQTDLRTARHWLHYKRRYHSVLERR
jgi:predicted PhzF superfamily epimerase YddE/YHI9